jgi:hypothetical protein
MNKTKQAIVILLAGLLFIAAVIRAAGHLDMKQYTFTGKQQVAQNK